MQSFSLSPESYRPPQHIPESYRPPQHIYMTLDSISGLCKRHRMSWWLAPVTVPKLCRVWTHGVFTRPFPG